jgi:hypothetical protein
VYAGVHPFKGTPGFVIPLLTMKGHRPLRKNVPRLTAEAELNGDVARKNRIWAMIEGCWDKNVEHRLRLDDVKRMLDSM